MLGQALHKDALLGVLPDQQVRRLRVEQVRDHLFAGSDGFMLQLASKDDQRQCLP